MHMNDEQRSAELRRAVGLYTRLVYGIALHELNGGSRADADDVFQEVFLLLPQARRSGIRVRGGAPRVARENGGEPFSPIQAFDLEHPR